MDVGQLEKALTDSRKELELLRVEYEHNMKAHEQIGPMAKEMRHLINSLQVIMLSLYYFKQTSLFNRHSTVFNH